MVDKQHLFDNFRLDIEKFLSCAFQNKLKTSFIKNVDSDYASCFLNSWEAARISLKYINDAHYNFDQVPDNAFDSITAIDSQINFFLKIDTKEASNLDDLASKVLKLNGSSNSFIKIMKNSKIYCNSNH